jgi:hypothetical protein
VGRRLAEGQGGTGRDVADAVTDDLSATRFDTASRAAWRGAGTRLADAERSLPPIRIPGRARRGNRAGER